MRDPGPLVERTCALYPPKRTGGTMQMVGIGRGRSKNAAGFPAESNTTTTTAPLLVNSGATTDKSGGGTEIKIIGLV